MDIDLSSLSSEQLHTMFKNAERALAVALLEGASYEQLQKKSEVVTQIALQLQKTPSSFTFKTNQSDNNTQQGALPSADVERTRDNLQHPI
jgi:hypothetical protein